MDMQIVWGEIIKKYTESSKYEVIVDNLPDLSSYKCKSFFKNSAGKLVPEVIGYAYKPILNFQFGFFRIIRRS